MFRQLFETTGRTHPADLTERDVLDWCKGFGRPIANNTARSRISYARTFLRWCRRHDLANLDLEEELASLRKSFPATYGKVQAPHPARWLSHDEGFGGLITACKDGTWIGSRDQLIVRLGLIGLRADEMRSLTWASVHPDGSLRIVGKARRTRVLRPGDTLTSLLGRWRRRYEHEIGRPVTGDDPVLCPGKAGHVAGDLYWGAPIRDTASIRWAVARRAKIAGLGHVAPHDLRRSAAGMLHDARTADGAHKFDLRDIQKVLGHASPETTERSYLSQIDHDAQDRAGQVLD